jgi:hypothetical protein
MKCMTLKMEPESCPETSAATNLRCVISKKIEEIQRVLETDRKDFQEAFQKWRRRWDRFYMQVGTTSRVTASDRPYGEFYDFYSVSP